MNKESGENKQPEETTHLLNGLVEHSGTAVIPVIEEHLHVNTKFVETGIVRLVKHVIEEVQTVDLPTTQEEVVVDRVAIYQYVETAPTVRYEGDTTIFPVLREVLVTEKKLLLVEEVHVTKRRVTEQNTQEFTLRKEEIDVERSTPANERPA